MFNFRLYQYSVKIYASALLFGAIAVNSSHAEAVTIGFDALTGMNFQGTNVPSASQLSNQLQSATGATFASESGASYVAVVNLDAGSSAAHAPSAPNGIGGATSGGVLSYSTAIVVVFSNPSNASQRAFTDFVSVQTDLLPLPGLVSLTAFGLNGNVVAMDSTPDAAGALLSVSAPGIYSVRLSTSTAAFDNLTFNAVTAVPEPSTFLLLASGLAAALLARKKKP